VEQRFETVTLGEERHGTCGKVNEKEIQVLRERIMPKARLLRVLAGKNKLHCQYIICF
jgi:hypothetical protein